MFLRKTQKFMLLLLLHLVNTHLSKSDFNTGVKHPPVISGRKEMERHPIFWGRGNDFFLMVCCYGHGRSCVAVKL